MKISLITPCYNSALTLNETIRSISQQTVFDSIEYIVVDGNSSDGTLEIIHNNRDKVDIFISEPDKGLYHAMNKGVRLATGDIIGILNSDDIYDREDVIEKVVDTFIKEKTDAVYGDLQYVNHHNEVVRHWNAGSFKRDKFKKGWMPPHPSFFVKRKIYEEYGLYNEIFRISADYELMLRFLFRHQISASYLPEVLVRMKTGGVSNGDLTSRFQALKEDFSAWKINKLDVRFNTLLYKRMIKLNQYLLFNRRYRDAG